MKCLIGCGKCCHKTAETILFTHNDITKWTDEDRFDILAKMDIYVWPNGQSKGSWKKELFRPDFVCPFLGEKGCTLGDLKPDKCEEYLCRRAKKEVER